MSQTMNCAEVMRALRVSRKTVKRMLATGELVGFSRDHLIRVTSYSVQRLLSGSPRDACEAAEQDLSSDMASRSSDTVTAGPARAARAK